MVFTSGFHGAGSSFQLMKLIPGHQIVQSAAGAIDSSEMEAIQFIDDCNITLNSAGAPLPVKAGESYECSSCDTITTDAKISYRWI